jgi:competence protein ComEA
MSGWLERNRGHILVLLLSLLAIAVSHIWIPYGLRSPPASLTIATPQPTATPVPTATPGPLRVYVSGAVARPDVYELPRGGIVKDAVEAAGGFAADADRERINLAQSLYDGQQVYLPHLGEAKPPVASPAGSPAAATPAVAAGGKVNINTATAQELEALPGIGPALAGRIVEYRTAHGPFRGIEEIKNVSGIGEKVFEEIKDLIEV